MELLTAAEHWVCAVLNAEYEASAGLAAERKCLLILGTADESKATENMGVFV